VSRYFINAILVLLLTWSKPLYLLAQNANPASGVKKNFEYYFESGESLIQSKEYLLAESYFDSARNIAVIQNNETKLGRCYLRLGTVKKIIGDLDLAMEYFTLAKDLFEKAKNYDLLAASHVELAELFRKITKHNIAHQHIQMAKKIYDDQNLNDTILLIKIHNRSAAINNEANPNFLVMIDESKKAIELSQAIGNDAYVAVSMNELGFMYKNHKKVQSSDSCYKEAERLWLKAGEYEDALYAMNNRAMLYLHNNFEKEKIIPIYERIVHLADSLNIQFTLHDPYYYLYRDAIEAGDSAKAFRYFFMGHEIDMQNSERMNNYNLHMLASKFENQKIKNEFNAVSSKLYESSNELEMERREARILIVSLAILMLLISIITFLLLKIRKSNKILLEKNSEKDSLIQEIHHRVKNNLQFVSSLLNMQVKSTQNAEEIEPLTEASRRISSMALVHEMLYNQADQKGISTKYYLEELIENLYSVVKSESQKIEFEMEIEDVLLNISDTISIGMITSELISNSMKHAFQNVVNPTVFLTLKQNSDGTILYSIRDNGKGFDEKEIRENRLGLRLVDIFSRQLKGTYSITGSAGFRYEMTFKKK
jgi:two-component sensor histidine kinase